MRALVTPPSGCLRATATISVRDVTLHVSVSNALRVTIAVLATNERVETEGEGQAGVTEVTRHSGWTHALPCDLITKTGARTSCNKDRELYCRTETVMKNILYSLKKVG